MKREFTFSGNLWKHHGNGAWYFFTVPVELSGDIDFYFAHVKRGWGSLKVRVQIGAVSWETSIFPDKKSGSYLLPVKKSVRTDFGLGEGSEVAIVLVILS